MGSAQGDDGRAARPGGRNAWRHCAGHCGERSPRRPAQPPIEGLQRQQHGRWRAPRATPKWLPWAAVGFLAACSPPGVGVWPTTTSQPVVQLEHATLEQRLAELDPPAAAGFRFVAFGDQRALADGEWQAMMQRIGALSQRDPRLLFMVDTGDIVHNGQHGDQFAFLAGILAPARRLPYLVSVGNHEVRNNDAWEARQHTAGFLQSVDAAFAPDRMYYRKDVGPACLLFLDTNDLVYSAASAPAALGSQARAARAGPAAGGAAVEARIHRQMEWLRDQLRSIDRTRTATVIVVMHHPIVQSSAKHREHAIALWSRRDDGRRLADLFADYGVDLVLTGHTHTCERFRLQRDDGRGFVLVNLSGRPRPSFLWIGDGARRARALGAEATQWMAREGWRDLEGWNVVQEYAMTESEADQYAVVDVGPGGELTMELRFLQPAAAGGEVVAPRVRLK